jgi:hypothetical protein
MDTGGDRQGIPLNMALLASYPVYPDKGCCLGRLPLTRAQVSGFGNLQPLLLFSHLHRYPGDPYTAAP